MAGVIRSDSDGGASLLYRFTWTKPNDPTWGGINIVRRVGTTDTLCGVFLGVQEGRFELAIPAANEAWTFYAQPFDVNGRTNTIQVGVTPSVEESITGATPRLDLGKAIASSVGAALAVVTGVLGVQPLGITTALIDTFAVSQAKLANAPIIDTARIVDLAVTTAKINNLAVTNALIANLAVTAAKIGDLEVTGAKIANATIASAKIIDLVADKITAGNLVVTMTVTAGSITGTSGSNVFLISAADGFKQTGASTVAQLVNGKLTVTLGTQVTTVDAVKIQAKTGANFDWLLASGTNGSFLDLRNLANVSKVFITAGADDASGPAIDVAGPYKVSGLQVMGARKTGWSAPTGSSAKTSFDTSTVTVSELAQRVKAVLDDLISHGLIGT